MSEQYKALAELQRPRPVRMSPQGKMNVVIISISLLVFAGVLIAMVALHPASPAGGAVSSSSPTPPRPVMYALPLALVAAIAFMMRRSLAQQKRLLVLGELAVARVTKQWVARNGSGIRYEFATPTGEHFSRMAADYSRRLVVGMNTPIFYDRQEPKKQAALCGAFYELVLPGRD